MGHSEVCTIENFGDKYNMKLRNIKVKNYRSLKDVEIRGLSSLTAFIGKNMSGKSNLFDCLVFLSEGVRDGLQAAIRNRGGWNEIAWRKKENEIFIELEFELKDKTKNNLSKKLFGDIEEGRYKNLLGSGFLKYLSYTLKFKASGAKNSFYEDLRVGSGEGKQSLLIAQNFLDQNDNKIKQKLSNLGSKSKDLLSKNKVNSELRDRGKRTWNCGGIKLLFYEQSIQKKPEFETALIEEFRENVEKIKWLNPFKKIESKKEFSEASILSYDASNLPDVIHSVSSNNPEKFNEFKKEVIKVLPGISNILSPVEGNFSTIGLKESEQPEDEFYKLDSFSSGVKNVLAILTILILSREKSLILIEEPETHLHPSAIRSLMEIVMKYSESAQVFFSTHSPSTLLNFKIENICLVKRNDDNNTIIKDLSYKDINSIIEELGIIPSDFFNRDILLFVEGKYDIAILEAFLEKLQDNSHNICLIPLDGWTKIKYQVNARVIKELQVKPKLFAILDGDIEKRPSEKEKLDNLKEELSLPEENIYTLERGEIESYLLDAEAWFKTWPELSEKINRDKLQKRFNRIIKASRQKEGMRSLMSELNLEQFTENVARDIVGNIDKIPEDIKKFLRKVE
jgi:predicted ATPase